MSVNFSRGHYMRLPKNNGYITSRYGPHLRLAVLAPSEKKSISIMVKDGVPLRGLDIETGPLAYYYLISDDFVANHASIFALRGVKTVNGKVQKIRGFPFQIGNVEDSGRICYGKKNNVGDISYLYKLFWAGIFTPDYVNARFEVHHKKCETKIHRCMLAKMENPINHAHHHYEGQLCTCNTPEPTRGAGHECRHCGRYMRKEENKFISDLIEQSKSSFNSVCPCCYSIALEKEYCQCRCLCDCHGPVCSCPCVCDTYENFVEYIGRALNNKNTTDITVSLLDKNTQRVFKEPTSGLYFARNDDGTLHSYPAKKSGEEILIRKSAKELLRKTNDKIELVKVTG